ncbi:hypothetical protein ACHAPT_001126, partial [Fusarium lateritium]
SLARLPFRQDGVRKGSIYLYRRDKNAHRQFWDNVDGSELLSRGWVFQEWLLSKRIIYFTSNESFLECSSQRPQSFCNDMVRAPPELECPTKERLPRLLNYGFKADFSSGHDSVFGTWYAAVRVFSTTALTKQGDHLAAMSGAASEYGRAIQNQVSEEAGKGKEGLRIPNYLSGLWLQDIHHSLMWLAHIVESPTCSCGAPSWSWLSCQGLIDWPPRDTIAQPALEILGAECEPAPRGAPALPETVVMTLKLRVKATMQPVLVVPGFGSQWLGSKWLLGETTGMQFLYSTPSRRPETASIVNRPSLNQPYIVCHPTTPDAAGGWAMFERSPDVGEWTHTQSGTVALAIHVASRRGGGGPGLARDFVKLRRGVYNVIFVKPVGDNTFRRLGAGMIFDYNVLKGFREDEGFEMTLI